MNELTGSNNSPNAIIILNSTAESTEQSEYAGLQAGFNKENIEQISEPRKLVLVA